MENNTQICDKISCDVVLTRKTGVASILLIIAEKGETLDELNLRYIPIHSKLRVGEFNPGDVAQLVLRYLSSSFGWYEVKGERRMELQEFDGVDRFGVKNKYKANVWVIPIEKHGALRH